MQCALSASKEQVPGAQSIFLLSVEIKKVLKCRIDKYSHNSQTKRKRANPDTTVSSQMKRGVDSRTVVLGGKKAA